MYVFAGEVHSGHEHLLSIGELNEGPGAMGYLDFGSDASDDFVWNEGLSDLDTLHVATLSDAEEADHLACRAVDESPCQAGIT